MAQSQAVNWAEAEQFVDNHAEVDGYVIEDGSLNVYFIDHSLVGSDFFDELRAFGFNVSGMDVAADSVQFAA